VTDNVTAKRTRDRSELWFSLAILLIPLAAGLVVEAGLGVWAGVAAVVVAGAGIGACAVTRGP
jgi:uncharacterized membrane protein